MWYPLQTAVLELESNRVKLSATPIDSTQEPDSLIVEISDTIRVLAAAYPTVETYIRDWIWVGSQYRIRFDQEPRDSTFYKARGYLLLLKQLRLNGISSALRSTDTVQILRWISDRAVADIQGQLGPASQNNFLTKKEEQSLNQQLKDLLFEPESLSQNEIDALDDYVSAFLTMSSNIYHPLAGQMVKHLIQQSESHTESGYKSVACLRYVLKTDDAVPDTLGYFGLVDDLQAIETTYLSITRHDTWAPVLNNFQNRWPFIKRIHISEATNDPRLEFNETSLPPFLQLISGAILNEITESRSTRACIVLPQVAFFGLVASFAASIESIKQRQPQKVDVEPNYDIGEDLIMINGDKKVRVKYAGTMQLVNDNIYHSIETRDSCKHILDKQMLSNILKPTTPHATLSTSKQWDEWKTFFSPSALTNIIEFEHTPEDIKPIILLLTQKNKLDRLESSIRPMGQGIGNLVGITYFTSNRRPINYGIDDKARCSIWACSDPLTARDLLEEHGSDLRWIISDESRLAVEMDGNLPSEFRDSINVVAICNQHETENINLLLQNEYRCWFLKESQVSPNEAIAPESFNIPGVISQYSQRQSLLQIVTHKIHSVRCDAIELLHEYRKDFNEALKENGQIELQHIALITSNIVKRMQSPILEYSSEERKEIFDQLETLKDSCSLMANYDQDVEGLRDFVQEIIEKGLPQNPRTTVVQDLLLESDPGSNTIILCHSAEAVKNMNRNYQISHFIGDVDDSSNNARWSSMSELRNTQPIDRIIVPGWLGRSTMRELRNNGYAKHVDYIFYPFEEDFETGSRNAGIRFEQKLNHQTRRRWLNLRENDPALAPPPDLTGENNPDDTSGLELDDSESEDLQLEARLIQNIQSHVTSGSGFADRTVKARVVLFEDPTTFIFIPANGKVISLSKVYEAHDDGPTDIDTENAENLISRPVAEVQRGDLLAFPEERRIDVLDEIADRLLSRSRGIKGNAAQIRQMANKWRQTLQDYMDQDGASLESLQHLLEREGLKRHPGTIDGWLSTQQTIAPLRYQDAIPRIASSTQNEDLTQNLSKVLESVDLVYKARDKAAMELLRLLLAEDIDLREHKASFQLEGHRINFILHRVSSISVDLQLVGSEHVGVLQKVKEFFSTTSTGEKR